MVATMDNVVSIPDDAIAFGEDATATTVVVDTKINKYPKLTSTTKRAEGALFSGPIRLVVDMYICTLSFVSLLLRLSAIGLPLYAEIMLWIYSGLTVREFFMLFWFLIIPIRR